MVLAVTIIVTARTLLLLMIHSLPGDPAAVLLGPRATPEMKVQFLASADPGGGATSRLVPS
ncbi:hypothetical protein X767_01285 [Mesorhizobium sp. LSJC264A00]|nr:hypothetical protein X767_01285 [Mesorhizobium sp. LSJC264A00]